MTQWMALACLVAGVYFAVVEPGGVVCGAVMGVASVCI
jgi:hypothetical protein